MPPTTASASAAFPAAEPETSSRVSVGDARAQADAAAPATAASGTTRGSWLRPTAASTARAPKAEYR